MLNLLIKKLKLNSLNNNTKHKVLVLNKSKSLGRVTHFSPTNREWVISKYNFNNNYNKHSSVKHQLATKILNSYFNLNSFNINTSKTVNKKLEIFEAIKKSRKSLKNIIISNLEIKERQDKVIINLSFFNKQYRLLNRKLLAIIRSLKIKEKISSNLLNFKNLIYIDKQSYSANKTKSNRISKYLITHFLNKRDTVKNIFMLHFLLWVLKIYKINIVKLDKNAGNPDTLIIKYEDNKLIYFTRESTIKLLPQIKELLLNIVKNKLTRINNVNTKLAWLFFYFKIKYLNKLLNQYMTKEMLYINYLYLAIINKYKFSKFIPQIKLILSNIFNKNIELNMVDVKYIFMNTDILTEVISTKLKYGNYKLMKLLAKSTNMVKLSSSSYNIIINKAIRNDIKFLSNNNLYDVTNNKLNIRKDALASTPYKWIKGMKIEVKGRLSKRQTASKSLFIYKYKGNLNNIDVIKGGTSNMLRTGIKPNMQYSFVGSTRQVGAFGIKGWISTK